MPEFPKFPGWRYHPTTGEGAIFQAAEEVPEGWVSEIADIKPETAVRPPRQQRETPVDDGLTEEQRAEALALETDHSQKELAEMLEKLNEGRDDDAKIEFLGNWPKKKLAQTIVANAPAEDDEDDEDDEGEEE